ncbi:MAG: ribonuclease HI [Oligoflexia bacterium]|nr:ribonuclease HI [Oligoflexia bacterium]
MEKKSSQPIILYTDGACSGNPGPGGWGSILLSPKGYVVELGGAEKESTNNRMELMAAIAGLEWLKERKELTTKQVNIYTDSKYFIQGLESWIYGWKKNGWKNSEGNPVANQDLWQRIDLLQRDFSLKLEYVPGHQGVPGNERCDRIAVAYSKGEVVRLFQGEYGSYSIDLTAPTSGSTKKANPYYLSYVGGQIYRDESWAECEKRVKGRAGAKYKKLKSSSEEDILLKSWGAK